MTPEDEQLMAYVDGELDPMARSQFERALAADPALVRRVAAQRELRSRLASSLDPQLAEPVPERLLQVARTAPAGKAPVVTLSAWRARDRAQPQAARPWGWLYLDFVLFAALTGWALATAVKRCETAPPGGRGGAHGAPPPPPPRFGPQRAAALRALDSGLHDFILQNGINRFS